MSPGECTEPTNLSFPLKTQHSLGVGIIRNLKHKYRKLPLRFVVSCVSESQIASQIFEEVHILRVISQLPTA